MNIDVDGGSVSLMNHTHKGDLLVVNAARCSFDKEHKEFDKVKDVKLLNYLAREKHILPFRHPSATLRVTAPIFVLRQALKSQVGMSASEVSRRYITDDPEFYHPMGQWRETADNVKQGSSDTLINTEHSLVVDNKLDEHYEKSKSLYKYLLNSGVCPEQARMVLPQSMLTTVVWTGTLLAWHHFVDLRMEAHAQKEIRGFAIAVDAIMDNIFYYSWNALKLASVYNKEG
jgi:thymidylate synthase (FAD)